MRGHTHQGARARPQSGPSPTPYIIIGLGLHYTNTTTTTALDRGCTTPSAVVCHRPSSRFRSPSFGLVLSFSLYLLSLGLCPVPPYNPLVPALPAVGHEKRSSFPSSHLPSHSLARTPVRLPHAHAPPLNWPRIALEDPPLPLERCRFLIPTARCSFHTSTPCVAFISRIHRAQVAVVTRYRSRCRCTCESLDCTFTHSPLPPIAPIAHPPSLLARSCSFATSIHTCTYTSPLRSAGE